MEKDKTITDIIKRLRTEISFDLLEVVDYWDADLCAIGLKRDNKMVYISTYNHTEKTEACYDFDLEIIDQTNAEKLNIVLAGRNVSAKELIEAIKQFLEA